MHPFLGCIGVAPANGEVRSSIVPAEFGGNMDAPEVSTGNTLYLPVNVHGALFYFGDGHAAMGDGEVAGSAVEVPMKARFRFELVKGTKYGLAAPGKRSRADDYRHLSPGRRRRPYRSYGACCIGSIAIMACPNLDAYELFSKVGQTPPHRNGRSQLRCRCLDRQKISAGQKIILCDGHCHAPHPLRYFQSCSAPTSRSLSASAKCGGICPNANVKWKSAIRCAEILLQLAAVIEDNAIREVRFLCRGCTASIACASLLTESIQGRELRAVCSIYAGIPRGIVRGAADRFVSRCAFGSRCAAGFAARSSEIGRYIERIMRANAAGSFKFTTHPSSVVMCSLTSSSCAHTTLRAPSSSGAFSNSP